jgi:hypothetical protein
MAMTGKPSTSSANKRPLTAYYNSIEGANIIAQQQSMRRGAAGGSTLKSVGAVPISTMKHVRSHRVGKLKQMREAN